MKRIGKNTSSRGRRKKIRKDELEKQLNPAILDPRISEIRQ